MSRLVQKLNKLQKSGDIAWYILEEQVTSCPETHKNSRLIDKLTIEFKSGATLKLSTFCSGCLENTTLELDEET